MARENRSNPSKKKDFNNEERSVKRPSAPGKDTPPKLPKKKDGK